MGSVRILLATDIENGKMLRSRFLEVRPPGYGFVASPLVSRYVSTPPIPCYGGVRAGLPIDGKTYGLKMRHVLALYHI
jgi:hypothetical protein